MNYILNQVSYPERVGTGSKEISAGKSFNSNSFEAFLPKDWEKKAKEGYQTLVSLGLRPPSDVFPPPLELYKEWNERDATQKRDGIQRDVTENSDDVTKRPLTPAERAKAYRDRQKLSS